MATGLADLVTTRARERNLCDEATLARLHGLVRDLADGPSVAGAGDPGDAPTEVLTDWCGAGSSTGHWGPHERCAVLFITVAVIREHHGQPSADPGLSVPLAPLTTSRKRPLLALELAGVRAAANREGDTALRRRLVALAEAGATTDELGRVTVGDIQPGTANVTLTGGRDTKRRTVALSSWGSDQIIPTTRTLDPGSNLAYTGGHRGPGGAAAASVSATGRRLLRGAGLDEVDVSLGSLRHTAALRAWNGRDLQPVLDVLGSTTRNAVQQAWDLVHTFDRPD